MAKPNDPKYWTKYYREHRDQRLSESLQYARDNAESVAGYHRDYYQANRTKWKRSKEQQAAVNQRRRERYASDAEFRSKCIEQSKITARKSPDRKLREAVKKYGVTLEWYWARHEYGCAICGEKLQRLDIDHCHRTGTARGLLCNPCNLGLGKFKDNPDTLNRAAMYLRSSQRKEDVDK